MKIRKINENGKTINGTSFLALNTNEISKNKAAFLTVFEGEKIVENKQNDEISHALLADINSDPASYREAMKTKDKDHWLKAIKEELDSMDKNNLWKLTK